MLETASSLNRLLLSPSQQDTYPDLEFHSPFMTSSLAEVSHPHGLVGQDMRHLAYVQVTLWTSKHEAMPVCSREQKNRADPRLFSFFQSRGCSLCYDDRSDIPW